MSILTKDINGNDVLEIFDIGVTIDQKLPKWVNAAKRIAEKKEKGNTEEKTSYLIRQTQYTSTENGTSSETLTMNNPINIYVTPDGDSGKKDAVDFDSVAAANLNELTELIKKGGLSSVLSGYGGMNGWNMTNEAWGVGRILPVDGGSDKKSFFSNIKKKIDRWLGKTFAPKPELNVIDFFTNVKLESKEGAEIYRDRVSKYLQAIHNANTVGQTALVEKLLSEMIANKYEALLASRGVYYAISEKRVVDFAKKTERGVSLTYIKNFIRPIPQDVIEKVIAANDYEVFDNYVVMHYDPKNEHKAETRKEEAKRKDPIIFGVIAGSRKLYYITDWVDEHCDLTLEKFVDTLGTTKDEFAEGPVPEKPKEEKKPEVEKKPRKKITKKTVKKKEEKADE